MELRATLRAPTGGRLEKITVLQLAEDGCLIEATQSLELGERVIIELSDGTHSSTTRGMVTALHNLQLVYNIHFDSGEGPSRELLAAVREADDDARR